MEELMVYMVIATVATLTIVVSIIYITLHFVKHSEEQILETLHTEQQEVTIQIQRIRATATENLNKLNAIKEKSKEFNVMKNDILVAEQKIKATATENFDKLNAIKEKMKKFEVMKKDIRVVKFDENVETRQKVVAKEEEKRVPGGHKKTRKLDLLEVNEIQENSYEFEVMKNDVLVVEFDENVETRENVEERESPEEHKKLTQIEIQIQKIKARKAETLNRLNALKEKFKMENDVFVAKDMKFKDNVETREKEKLEEHQNVLKVGDRVQALKMLNDDDEHIILKNEILIVFADEEKESHILVELEKNNQLQFVLKKDYIYLKQLKPVENIIEKEVVKNDVQVVKDMEIEVDVKFQENVKFEENQWGDLEIDLDELCKNINFYKHLSPQ